MGLLLKAVRQANGDFRLNHVGCPRAYGTAAGLSVPASPWFPRRAVENCQSDLEWR